MRPGPSRVCAALLAVGLAAGCAGEKPVAATVNGEPILASEVDRDLADIDRNEPFLEARTREGSAFRGTKPGTYDAFAVAELLSRKVTAVLVRQELGHRRLTAGPGDREQARATVRLQLVDPSNGASLLDGFPKRYVDQLAGVQADSDLLQAAEGGVALDEAALRAAYDTSPDRYRTWCVRWILFEGTEDGTASARAAAAASSITAGQDFAGVAVRESADTGSAGRGGALGCLTRDGLARLGDAFRDAAVSLGPGQVSAPTASAAGTFLVQVTDVRAQPFDEVRGIVRTSLLVRAQEPYDELLRRLRRAANVTVGPRFGTWDRSNPDAISLVPPGGRPADGRPSTSAAPAPTSAGP